jgi:hypothetical protein
MADDPEVYGELTQFLFPQEIFNPSNPSGRGKGQGSKSKSNSLFNFLRRSGGVNQ